MQSITEAGQALAGRIRRNPQTPAEAAVLKAGAMSTVKKTSIYDLEITHPLIRSAVDMVERWAKARKAGVPMSIVLTGPRGTGKSTIARAILSSMMVAAVEEDDEGNLVAVPGTERFIGRRWKAADLLPSLGDEVLTGPNGSRIHRSQMDLIVGDAPIVVVDDVGAEGVLAYVAKESQAEEKALRYLRLIDFIYERNMRAVDLGVGVKTSLVITSNLSCVRTSEGVPSPLESLLGGRAWNRLQEMAPKGFQLDLTGVPSYRSKLGGFNYEPEAEY